MIRKLAIKLRASITANKTITQKTNVESVGFLRYVRRTNINFFEKYDFVISLVIFVFYSLGHFFEEDLNRKKILRRGPSR